MSRNNRFRIYGLINNQIRTKFVPKKIESGREREKEIVRKIEKEIETEKRKKDERDTQ